MKSLRAALALPRGLARGAETQWWPLQQRLQAVRVAPNLISSRSQWTAAGPDSAQLSGDLSAATSIIHARPVPVSPSYFSRSTHFNDDYVRVRELFRRLQHLPQAPPDKVRRVAWKKLADYELAYGEAVRASDYSVCINMAKHLHKIHPDLQSDEVRAALVPFMRDVNPHDNVTKPIPIDRFGRALGVGRRKTSVARAWVVEGTGEVLVNGKTLSEAFGRVHDRESAIWALKAAERLDKYNVWALVDGGGTTGQAEALALAVAKALMAHEPALKPALRRAGCVTRDPRMVERKKPGHVKARKMPAWVKR